MSVCENGNRAVVGERIVKHLDGVVQKADDVRRHLVFVASRQEVDRDGDLVLTAGIDTSAFRLNPVLLDQHDREREIGKVTALRVETRAGAPALIAEAELLPAGVSAAVDELWARVQFGARSAISISFLPRELGAPVLPGQTGATVVRCELVEISSVTLPSCRSCIVESKAWLERGSGPGRERMVIELDEDEEPVIDVNVANSALAALLPALIAQGVARGAREGAERALRRANGDADDLFDADVARTKRAEYRAAAARDVVTLPEGVDIAALVRQVITDTAPSAISDAVDKHVRAAWLRACGRVD